MTPVGLLSGGWIEQAYDRLKGLSFPHHELTVEFRCIFGERQIEHHLVFAKRSLIRWSPGRATAPHLRLQQPLTSHVDMFLRRNLGDDLMRASRLVAEHGELRPVPPLDEVDVPWGRDLPVYPGVGELMLQQVLTHSPFGDVSIWFRIKGGPVVDAGVGLMLSEPDILIHRHYGAALSERAGDVDLLESIEGGSLRAENRKLMLFIGGYDSDECAEARRSLARATDVHLGALGELLCSPSWVTAADRLSPLFNELESVP